MRQQPLLLSAVGLFASLCAAAPALSQPKLLGPRIYDATGRLVGPALPMEEKTLRGRVLLSFDKGEAVLNISPVGLDSEAARLDRSVYFTKSDCSSAAYLRVQHFPNDGLFTPQGQQRAGYTQAGAVQYASRPFTSENLVATKANGICSVMTTPLQSLVGVIATVAVPAYRLPFDTK
jgi:hypothetical protein